MATPYQDIFGRALFRLSDTKLAQLHCFDQQTILSKYMKSAIADFQNKCEIDLSNRNEEEEIFNEDIPEEVQEILALGISYYWLSAQVLNNELLKNKLSTKDYTYFSPANLLRESTALRKEVQTEYKHRIINYTYDHGNLSMDASEVLR